MIGRTLWCGRGSVSVFIALVSHHHFVLWDVRFWSSLTDFQSYVLVFRAGLGPKVSLRNSYFLLVVFLLFCPGLIFRPVFFKGIFFQPAPGVLSAQVGSRLDSSAVMITDLLLSLSTPRRRPPYNGPVFTQSSGRFFTRLRSFSSVSPTKSLCLSYSPPYSTVIRGGVAGGGGRGSGGGVHFQEVWVITSEPWCVKYCPAGKPPRPLTPAHWPPGSEKLFSDRNWKMKTCDRK